jgi:dTDP-4-dehydrorhamnose reductase
MKVLVIGSKGQLGTELQRTAPPEVELIAVDVDELDITNLEQTRTFISDKNPQAILNAAAYTAVDKAEGQRELAHKVNATGIENIALAAKEIGARVIHVSTDYVFNGRGYKPYTVDDKCEPLGVYGETKYEGEQALIKIMESNYVIVRTAWLYSSHGANFVKTMLRLMAEREELNVVADQIGSPTTASGLAAVLWEFFKRPEVTGVFHWTDDGVASWYDFAVAIKEEAVLIGMLDKNCASVKPIPTSMYPTPAERPHYSVLDKTATCAVLEYSGVHWRDGLRSVLGELKANAQ